MRLPPVTLSMPYTRPTRRQSYWREIQKFFDSLPVEQFHQAALLSHNLALSYSDDGQLRTILLRRQDYPLLDQHFWLLNDWSVHNPGFEKHLMLGLTFRFMELDLRASISDPFSHQDETFLPLAQKISHQADQHFTQLFLDSSYFWEHDKFSASPSDPDLASRPWALIPLSTTLTALAAGRESQLPQLLEMTDHLRVVYQTVTQLSSLRRDLREGKISHPIQRVMRSTGISDPTKLSADFLFGALVISGTLEKICAEGHMQVEAARLLAARLDLPSFIHFCDETDSLLRQIAGQFGLKRKAAAESEPLLAFFAPAVDVIPNILKKAEGYLFSDPTFREAWEVQQDTHQFFPLLIGQVFPTALILEMLALHGHDVSAMTDKLFELYQSTDFRYYDIPESLAPDIDDIAFAIRVHGYASHPERCRELLQRPLRWIRENQLPSGQIPVWLKHNDSHYQMSPLSILYGENCATVEANLMIGLIDYDWNGFQDIITACAASWCERWLTMGLGATEHYTPLFSFWTSLELISRLLKKPIRPTLRDDLIELASRLKERMQTEGGRDDLTPQAASFLTLTCFRLPEFGMPFDPRWLTVLIKHQQWDGKWPGEPIFVVPSGRGLGTLWISSHTITTAFCYHAIKTYQACSGSPVARAGHLQESAAIQDVG